MIESYAEVIEYSIFELYILTFSSVILEDLYWLFALVLIASTVLFMVDTEKFPMIYRRIALFIHIVALIILVTYLFIFVGVNLGLNI